MDKLTEPAKLYCQAIFEGMEREALVEILEGQLSIQCYDHEDTDTLAESVVVSVEAGDIEFDWSHDTAKASSRSNYHLWLDIEDVWE